MNPVILNKEVKSKAMQHIIEGLSDILNRLRNKELERKTAISEITIYKHTIQAIALDWLYSGYQNKIEKVTK